MLENKINLMLKNSTTMDNVKGTFGEGMIKKCAALNLTLRNIEGNSTKISDCRKVIKDNTFLLSNFRGYNLLNCATLLSLECCPKESFEEIKYIYEKLKDKFFTSSFLPLAAQIIFDGKELMEIDEAINKTRIAYDYMKKDHIFLTGCEDVSAAAMIAITSRDLDKDFEDIEACYKILREKAFFGGDKLQSLSHILALFKGSPEEKCEKVIKLDKALKNQKVPIRSYALPILGVCAFVTDDFDRFACDVKKVNDMLKHEYGFGSFSIGYTVRSMIAASLVSSVYLEECNDNKLANVTNNATLNIIIVMLIAASAAAAGAAAAAASSSSS